jgi:hypothetical protein
MIEKRRPKTPRRKRNIKEKRKRKGNLQQM